MNLRGTVPSVYDNCIINLLNTYSGDIDANVFKEEIMDYIHFAKNGKLNSPTLMYEATKGELVSIVANVDTFLKIYSSIHVSKASAEPLFSVLKRVQNYIRNSNGEGKVRNLAIIYTENDITKNFLNELI